MKSNTDSWAFNSNNNLEKINNLTQKQNEKKKVKYVHFGEKKRDNWRRLESAEPA